MHIFLSNIGNRNLSLCYFRIGVMVYSSLLVYILETCII
jgi:hypothetical protein